MKRLVAVISSLLVLPAFAEIAPQQYIDENVEYVDAGVMPVADEIVTETVETDAEVAAEPEKKTPTVAAARSGALGRVSASRAIGSTRQTALRNRMGASRASVARTTTNTATRTVSSRATPMRATVSPKSGVSGASVARAGATTARAGATTVSATNLVQKDTVNTPLYTGRVGVRTNTASIGARVPTIRVNASSTTTTTTTAEEATSTLNDLAEMTDFCKAQYTACMDNFCNVLDDNQGRCSCSVNLKNYAKTEDALKQATESLQDVAQKIQYIGLSAAEVETLFTQTAAELQMQSTSDSSQIKNDLDKIKSLIVDVKSGSATVSDTGLSVDLSGLLDFSIDSSGFDLSSFLGNKNDGEAITNQRGEQLYKTAAARCKASVLNSCKSQGVDINIVTNAYDLEIDKQCILYERSLTDANDNMTSTVRNAKSVLQKARLLVAQNKNSYDLRGCVNALDTCMQDDFVCGDEYENCLDPTGRYIVNGEIVIGSTPGISGDIGTAAIYDTWEDSTGQNAWGDGGTVASYIANTVAKSISDTKAPAVTSDNLSEFLQYKIGYHVDDTDRNFGMCMSVLNKCQNITYEGTGTDTAYKPDNNVIKEFLQRTLVQIKAKQDEILAEHAQECSGDVVQCLAQNNYDADKEPTESVNAMAIAACKATIVTCVSVNLVEDGDYSTKASFNDWVKSLMNK